MHTIQIGGEDALPMASRCSDHVRGKNAGAIILKPADRVIVVTGCDGVYIPITIHVTSCDDSRTV